MPAVIRPLSLSSRIVAGVALGLTLILLLFGLLALWTIHESTQAAFNERVLLAQALARRIDDVLAHALVSLERTAADLDFETDHPLDLNQRQRLEALRSQLGIFSILSVTVRTGETTWTDPGWAGVLIGNPLFHSGAQLALHRNEPQITELLSPFDGETVFACLTVPLRDAGGQPVGVLMAEIDPSQSGLHLLPSGESKNGLQVQLVYLAGSVLAGGGEGAIANPPGHQALLEELFAAGSAGFRIHQPPGWTGVGSHVIAYAPLATLPAIGIVVEQNRDVIVETGRRLEQRSVLFGIAALVLATTIAWVDVRRVVRPLHRLTSIAERFAAGQLDEPVRLDRADELGTLGSALETMRERLQASLAEVAEWNRELERRVQTRTEELVRRNQQLRHLNAIAATVSGSTEVKTMLERTLDHVLEFTRADAGCFWVAEGEAEGLSLAAERGLPAALQAEHIQANRCLCGRAARLRRSLVGRGDGIDPEALACHAANLKSALAVPVPAGDSVQGVLFVASRRANHFGQADLAVLTAVGRQVGIALANARLYQTLQAGQRERAELLQRLMNGQEEERRRLAQELHDETSQALTSLQLGLERLAAGIEDPAQARRLAAQLQGVAAKTLVAVHRLAVELRPSVLDDLGLVAAIDRYLREYGRRYGVVVDLAPVGVDYLRLIPAAETAIYRIVQAALTNAVQHGHAGRVSVSMQRRSEKLVVVVEDDGGGFDLATVRAAPLEKRLGLAGMEERAALIGAALTLETTPGSGTSLFLEVPLESNLPKDRTHVEVTYHFG